MMLLINFLLAAPVFPQDLTTTVLGIPAELKENANSVIRNQEVSVEIKSISQMVIKTLKTITVFNEYGIRNIDAVEYFDQTTTIKNIEAIVYDSLGKELKKIKRKDFSDYSVAGDASDVSDTRVLKLNYTPTEYPFTIVYQSEVQTSNTAFIPTWYPIDDYFESVQRSVFKISYPSHLGFKYKEMDFGDKKIVKHETTNSLQYSIENLVAEKHEEYAPSKPVHVLFGLDKFMLEGVEGSAKSWKEFGLWMNEKLLKESTELPLETQNRIKTLVANETDPLKKAAIVYRFVQNKTRYVSIQLGIGGWKPMPAKNVDRLGYGDCKALSNYTKALLDVVGVPSYYTVIYGGERRDILEDFVSMQGNHAVLSLPYKNKMIFLECTSQTQAFGFEGDFTDDRVALLIKPEGGELVRTNKYIDKDNAQVTNGKIVIHEDGSMKMEAQISYTGIQYDTMTRFELLPLKETKDHYKERWSYVNNLTIDDLRFVNDKENVKFNETIKISVPEFVKKTGADKMLLLNVLNQNYKTPQRYRNRKKQFEIDKGYYDEDIIDIELPQSEKVIAKPENVNLETKFGTYSTEILFLEANKIQYKRKLLIKKGLYSVEEYEEFRKFREQIAKNDNSKLVLQSNK
ncbi:DUF3857 domain-containing protein [Flavobacterium luminosum]|uniref:DUF3857 domain-containing protein n=1 Tax=Flavobacterium luminosum TaxID=2949086 RepID=A0ABT0TPG8_9FLAO|nr:DUF3857 domain-containing protein [Flavobacterium sp. HXWNR70]MCL9809382.1 DUF3857 domain-containing protein [Flavobacterium sp. HXWNR70]